MNEVDRGLLFQEVCRFKNAILEAKWNGDFSSKDVMRNFPHGCCEFASDLLAHYLDEIHRIKTIHLNGRYEDDNPENLRNHEWLTCGKMIIDITYAQFNFATGSKDDIYVGPSNDFFDSLTDVYKVPNYDIRQNPMLYDDYKKICKYLNCYYE